MTTSPLQHAGGRQTQVWDRPAVIEAIREWTEVHGETPRASDWNPSSARWAAQTWRIPRYHEPRPSGGHWPSLNAAKRPFGGSLNAALIAAGYEPNKPGPRRHDSVRPDVVDRVVQEHPEFKAALAAAESRARKAEARCGALVAELARRPVKRERARPRPEPNGHGPTRTITKTKVRTVTKPDGRVLRRAKRLEARADVLAAELVEARRAATEARLAATRAASKQERAEATITGLREERRELKRDLDRAEDAAARTKANAKPRVREVVRVEREIVERDAPEAVEVERARQSVLDAAQRVAVAERKYGELAALVTGEARVLTAAEMRALRRRGPSGPAVLARALVTLKKARAKGGRDPLRSALREVAAAAVAWLESL